MATYGSRDRNPFRVPKTYDLNGKPVPSNNGNTGYYTLVDSGTGEITVKSPTAGGAVVGASGDRTVGTIPKDGVFKPEPGSATTNEVQYFTSAQGQKDVKNHAVITAQKAGLNPQKSKQLIFPNTATPGGVPGTTPGTTPAAPGESKSFNKDLFKKDTVAEAGTRSDFKQKGPLIYPTDIGATKQDIIKFDMLEYKPKEFNEEKFGFSKRERTFSNTIGTVILPIPSGISDTNACNWNQDDMNAKKVEEANIILSGATGGGEGAANAAENTVSKLSSNTSDVAKAFLSAIAGGGGLLTRTTGNVINPNLELLFQSPTLRTFGFTFKMSARSEPEAKTIIAILRFFKQGMSAQRSKSNLFLKTPHTFGIRYMHRGQTGEEHKYIGKIKECALTSFTVNYTPEGQYATFYDGPMVSYEMQMQFQELEPIFNDDYGKDDFNEIGF